METPQIHTTKAPTRGDIINIVTIAACILALCVVWPVPPLILAQTVIDYARIVAFVAIPSAVVLYLVGAGRGPK
jgi:hypothetical protein